MKYYLEVLKKYAVFSGRAGRAEFWWFFLINSLIIVGLIVLQITLSSVVGRSAVANLAISMLSVVYWLAILIPSLAVTVRRLHDSNLSGWWLLISFVPFGGIVLLVFYILASTPGANRFGPNPNASAGGTM
ncbi:DUF805 domain-containing protein [Candidatus Uhrbacteria bacterium CG_4_10_14_0_8_um_filter_58_22]|uniref:DUF805 domain-containing protein n=1 Tax=Candidatus Uhrbacteria bacterium CG_4_10_14_0_8_um_filter_58_22 TaxID=1975029 RepID=A0A2M7Q971_9BACT|nr:MAG: hypothetical protein AUJ19_00635 [Parcubacteria group bacterium CG1_02_58_44]PIY62117.1 MAG: DUF805 domain-containing protein [Candidatus Uhrbacteria bacterium CG_4_10_14_0_8_um_filter_58_22]